MFESPGARVMGIGVMAEISAGSKQDEGTRLCSRLLVTGQLLQLAMARVHRLCGLRYRPLQGKCIFLVVANKSFSLIHVGASVIYFTFVPLF